MSKESNELKAKKIQQDLSKGGIVNLSEGEITGDFIIKKPTTLKSRFNSTTFIGTLEIKSKDVYLENISLVPSFKSDICLVIKKDCTPNFRSVIIQGRCVGLDKEDDRWELPNKLEILLIPDQKSKKRIVVNCPVPVKIYPVELEDIKCSPPTLKPGINEIELNFGEFSKNLLIVGSLILESHSTGLKRKISLYGNSFEENKLKIEEQKIDLWLCPSAKVQPDFSLLQSTYFGRENELFNLEIELTHLKLDGYQFRADGLPSEMRYMKNGEKICIEGVPTTASEYNLDFTFTREGNSHSYKTKLLIEEKKVVEILCKPFSVTTKENDFISQRIEVISSNSQSLTFKALDEFPDELNLNPHTGEIFGKIVTHGTFLYKVLINDSYIDKELSIHFQVLPKAPLELNSGSKQIQCVIGEDFSFPLHLQHNDDLIVTYKFVNLNPMLSIIKKGDEHFVTGKITAIGAYNYELEIIDIYNRHSFEQITIVCVERPLYILTWNCPLVYEVVGKLRQKFTYKIAASIKTDPTAQIQFYIKKTTQFDNIELSENGILAIVLSNSESYTVEVVAKYKGFEFEKDLIISTSLITESRIVSVKTLGGAFSKPAENSNNSDYFIEQLPMGIVGKYYESDIIKMNLVSKNQQFTVSNLPKGMYFNNESKKIQGIPECANVVKVYVNDQDSLMLKEFTLIIKKANAFDQVTDEQVEIVKKEDSIEKKEAVEKVSLNKRKSIFDLTTPTSSSEVSLVEQVPVENKRTSNKVYHGLFGTNSDKEEQENAMPGEVENIKETKNKNILGKAFEK